MIEVIVWVIGVAALLYAIRPPRKNALSTKRKTLIRFHIDDTTNGTDLGDKP